MIYGVINAHMFGLAAEPGEHVNWSEPSYLDEVEFEWMLGDVAAYAASNPHMIVWED